MVGMTLKNWMTLSLIVLLTGCRGLRQDDQRPVDSAGEISVNPQLLADFGTPIEQLSLRGVQLGDLPEAIKANRIISQGKDSWIVCRDLSRYRIVGGRVVTLGVWDQKILSQLGIETEADIERVFGKAESIEKVDTLTTRMTIHFYAGGQRRVSWDRIQNRLGAVNIGVAATHETGAQPASTP